jgi:hypothetical protein
MLTLNLTSKKQISDKFKTNLSTLQICQDHKDKAERNTWLNATQGTGLDSGMEKT